MLTIRVRIQTVKQAGEELWLGWCAEVRDGRERKAQDHAKWGSGVGAEAATASSRSPLHQETKAIVRTPVGQTRDPFGGRKEAGP